VPGRATVYSTFSIFGLQKKKKAKNIFQNLVGVQFEIRKRKLLDYKEAIYVKTLKLCGVQ